MSKIPPLTYSDLAKLLRKHGFHFDRMAKSSHEIWWSPDTKKRLTVPHHSGSIPIGTIRAIIKATGMDADEFLK
ncbi:MAG: type II toxin-antitoxin system HicA family toxin [Chthonomonadales bacterium]